MAKATLKTLPQGAYEMYFPTSGAYLPIPQLANIGNGVLEFHRGGRVYLVRNVPANWDGREIPVEVAERGAPEYA